MSTCSRLILVFIAAGTIGTLVYFYRLPRVEAPQYGPVGGSACDLEPDRDGDITDDRSAHT